MAAENPFPPAIAGLLQTSKAAAKQDKYDTALKIASDALRIADYEKLAPQHIITLLDHRHAIHMRRDDMDAAFTDTKAMIRLDRTDARGYIRASRVKRLQDENSAAIRYLEHGLQKVSPSDPNFSLLNSDLKAIRQRIAETLVTSKAQDPMTALPLEVAEMVLSYIAYRQIVRMLRVSKSWKKILLSAPPLTDTLAFPNASKPIDARMLLSGFRRLRVARSIAMVNLGSHAVDILQRRLQTPRTWQFLEYLEIDNDIVRPESLDFSQFNLKTLIIGHKTLCRPALPRTILDSCPRLEVLRIAYIREGLRFRSSHPLFLSSTNLLQLRLIQRYDRTVSRNHCF
jgi:F-box/TPR repeat protein Pof3